MTSFAIQLGSPVLDANLAAIETRSPQTAALIRQATPRADLQWVETDESLPTGAPVLSASLDGRALASKRRPLEEGEAFARAIDLNKAGTVVVLGFGLGYHLGALSSRARRHTAILIFEPDVTLLRAVLERIDCSQWIRETNCVFFTDPGDSAAVARDTQGLEPLLAVGVAFVEHAASRARLGAAGKQFSDAVTRVVGSVRTQVITTMMQMGVTVRNLLMNCDHYAMGAGIADLAGIARGAPAIVVSAGPSLRRNIELLRTPGLRDRCVIIAVQTVLKQLLGMGIRPHFVTALDYHEISARFYEGLSAEDVRGVTLIAEPKANPAILQSFPGQIRMVQAEYLDRALERDLAGEHGAIKPGATVAHLAYYFARHLGADPVILMGQDLAFTDGQYYSAGAAIHDVWASELNDFNTLEMMEWQRIVRWRGHLHTRQDHLGRPIYTDDQMSTYLGQFERDFLSDRERGLTIIDATEGGVAKAHAQIMPLREALDRYASPAAPLLPEFPQAASRSGPARMRQLKSRLDRVRRDVKSVSALSREAAALLERMPALQRDTGAINALIEKVQGLRERVQKLEPAYGLVHRLNQAGAFKRLRADRLLHIAEDLGPLEVQRRQIERDQMNVSWLADAADSLEETLSATLAMLDGGPRLMRDPAPPSEQEIAGDSAETGDAAPARAARRRTIAAVIPVDPDISALGWRRDLGAEFLGRNPLRMTLERLARCRHLERVTLLTHDPDRVRALAGAPIEGLAVEIESIDAELMRAHRATVAPARLWARSCWRGGLGYATAWDEVFDPRLVASVMTSRGLDAAFILGADWSLIDPALCDQVIERYLEDPDGMPMAFPHAPPGAAGLIITAGLAGDLAKGRAQGDHFASIGGLLGFSPLRPRTDAIAGRACVQCPPVVRDCSHRLIPDSPAGAQVLASALQHLDPLTADIASIANALAAAAKDRPGAAPERITIELCVDRSLPLLRSGARRAPMDLQRARELVSDITRAAPHAAVTLAGFGDPLLHPGFHEIVRMLKDAGAPGVHVRTDLLAPPEAIDALLESGADVISVDTYAGIPELYERLTGANQFSALMDNIDRLLKGRRLVGGMKSPWIVPRMTRRDAVYEHIENHFDKGLYFTGAATIDPLAAPIPGERIAPFPKPAATALRDWRSRMCILCDGEVIADERDAIGAASVANAFADGVAGAWGRLMDRRFAAWRESGPGHADLWTGW